MVETINTKDILTGISHDKTALESTRLKVYCRTRVNQRNS